jgi:hypothetical protein
VASKAHQKGDMAKRAAELLTEAGWLPAMLRVAYTSAEANTSSCGSARGQ